MSLDDYIDPSDADDEGKANSIKQVAFEQFLKQDAKKDLAFSRPLEHWLEDVTRNPLTINLKALLNKKDYKEASFHAKGCLEISLEAHKVPLYSVNNWLQNSIHTLDPLLLHYIHQTRKETIEKPKPKGPYLIGKERWPYHHLIDNYDKPLQTAGHFFDGVYLYLNDTKHLKINDEKTKKFTITKRPWWKIQKNALLLLAESLRILLTKFEEAYPKEKV